MSYQPGPMVGGSPGRVRPGIVTVSSYLIFLLAGLQAIGTIMAFVFLSDMRQAYDKAFANVDNGDDLVSFSIAMVVIFSVVSLLFDAGMVVLAIFNNRGKNGTRITTWVLGGITLCCGGLGFIGNAAGGSFGGNQGGSDMPSKEELQQALNDAIPSWYNGLSTVIEVVGLLALLVALILLALPPANDFFRKPQPEWQPPAAGEQGYVAYPAYPATGVPPAGQPPYPPAGQPPYPPAGQPGYPPAGQPPYPPAGQPGYPPAGQPPYPPAGQPGYPPADPGVAQPPAGPPAQPPVAGPGTPPPGQPPSPGEPPAPQQ